MALKQRLTEDGYFRYDDMFAFALAHMRATPSIIEALRWRFPVVFTDEMQDTNPLQDGVITTGFGADHCIQRFGDINQGIFHGEDDDGAGTTFPRAGAIRIDDSRRLDEHVAGVATRLALHTPQTITGRPAPEVAGHSLILFDNASIERVLEAFGDIVLDHAPVADQAGWVCKAIGYRRRGDGQQLPRHVGDYWPAWERPEGLIDQPAPSLLTASRQAMGVTRSLGHTDKSLQIIWRALIHWFRLCELTLPDGARISRRAFIQLLTTQPGADASFRELLRVMVMPSAVDQDGWHALTGALIECVIPWIPVPLPAAANDYLVWQQDPPNPEEAAAIRHDVYRHVRGERFVDIHVGTTHSVKGETHHATLVLETQKRRVFDTREAVPFLVAQPGGQAARNNTASEMLRVMFVSVSRPSRILCIAIHKDHVPVGSWQLLRNRGWVIRDITEGN